MRLSRSLIAGAAVAMLLTACAGGTTTAPDASEQSDLPAGVVLNKDGTQGLKRNDPVTGGSLKVALMAPAQSLDPAMLATTGDTQIMQAIFDVLFTLDGEGNVVPELAESLETTDNGKTWTMKLPSGVKFTDGTPFNAAAVVAHVQRVAAPGATSRTVADARQIESMATPDDTTVVFTLKAASLAFPKSWGSATSALSMIPSPTAIAAGGDQAKLNPVGAGPFKLESFQSDGNTKLVRNPDYRIKGLPYLDSVEFVTATDTQSRLSATIAGDIDLSMTQSGTDLKAAEDAGLVALYEPTFSYYTMLLNYAKPPFNDVRFRKAVIQSINLDGVNDAVFDGLHNVMHGIFPKDNPFYVENEWPQYDPEAAKELLEEWQADTGLEPAFEVITTSPPEFQKQTAIIQQMLKDVGITMSIVVGDQPSMIAAGISGNYTAQLRFTTLAPEVDQSAFSSYFSKSASNHGKVADPKLDELLLKAQATVDVDERAKVYADMQELLVELVPVVPLVQQQVGWYATDRVGGFPGVWPGSNSISIRDVYIAE